MSYLFQVATMAAVKHLLEEILNDLSCEELEKFKKQLIGSFWVSSDVPLTFSQTKTSTDIVDVMVQSHGQQSVEVTKMILMDMNRTDLVERLSETSSGPKGETKKTQNFHITQTCVSHKCVINTLSN